jgi:Xaa-Pro aminopeptidase
VNSIFTSDFFVANRKRLRESIGDDNPIIVTAHANVQRSGDVAYQFRQDSNFWYLTGITIPDIVLVMSQDDFLILPERDAVLDTFEGAIDSVELQRESGITKVYNYHEGWEKLITLLKTSKHVNAPLYKSYDDHHKLFLNPAKSQLIRRLKKLSVEVNDIRKHLVHMRMIKQPLEIAAIKQAVDITIDAFLNVFQSGWVQNHPNERSIQAAVEYKFAASGCQPAYPSIVAGGNRACTLHYTANDHDIDRDELLLIDAGAEYNNYAADITRVYTARKMTTSQQEVYRAVKDAQAFVIDQLKPGVDLKGMQTKVSRHIGKFLKARHLITSLKPEQVYKYYPHAISHHLGLDVHDVADYSQPLQAGMVITVEPGIYIKEEAIGVRIEDDILITKNGAEVLSRRLPS